MKFKHIYKAIVRDERIFVQDIDAIYEAEICAECGVKNERNLGFGEYNLLDVCLDRSKLLLVHKDWLSERAYNRSIVKVVDVASGEMLFETRKLLTYRAMFDASGEKILLEAYSGAYMFDIKSGARLVHQKFNGTLEYATLLMHENRIYMPLGRKQVLVCDFKSDKFIKFDMPCVALAMCLVSEQRHFITFLKGKKLACYLLAELEKIFEVKIGKFEFIRLNFSTAREFEGKFYICSDDSAFGGEDKIFK